MTVYVAFLRAVNVGGHGKLAMRDLVSVAEGCGFQSVGTYIASGNLVFTSDLDAERVGAKLEAALEDFTGGTVAVMVRSAGALRAALGACPFIEPAGSRVAILFLAGPLDAGALLLKGVGDEEVVPGLAEVFVHYPGGMGRSRLKIEGTGPYTARNRNTVERMVEMAAALGG